MKTFLGVDAGGSKTRFLLIDDRGQVRASHSEGSGYYLETGLDALREMLARGIGAVLRQAGITAADLTYAFLGLPAYGEDQALLPVLDAAPSALLARPHYRCGNDMVCGWAGALAGHDGINVVVGTGSIAYGEYAGRSARCGGWGELFSDEGSAYWFAREGLRLFSRMSDGRTPRGALYGLVRAHFGLRDDLDLCASIYGTDMMQRSRLASLSKLVAEAATAGDAAAQALFAEAVREIVEIVEALRTTLAVPGEAPLAVSATGGMLGLTDLVARPLQTALESGPNRYRFVPARFEPHVGAALHAARLAGAPLSAASLDTLAGQAR